MTNKNTIANRLSNTDKVIENRFFERAVSSEDKRDLSILITLKNWVISGGDATINLLLCSTNGGIIITRNPVKTDIIIMYVSAILKTFGNFNLTKKLTIGDNAETKITATNKIIKRSRIRYIIQRDKIKMVINIIVL